MAHVGLLHPGAGLGAGTDDDPVRSQVRHRHHDGRRAGGKPGEPGNPADRQRPLRRCLDRGDARPYRGGVHHSAYASVGGDDPAQERDRQAHPDNRVARNRHGGSAAGRPGAATGQCLRSHSQPRRRRQAQGRGRRRNRRQPRTPVPGQARTRASAAGGYRHCLSWCHFPQRGFR